jgi:hypothetical protein
VPLGLLIWLPSGPLATGWAQKAGTPASLLAPTSSASSPSAQPAASFTTHASGRVDQAAGNVDISLSIAGQQLSHLAIHLRGQPIEGGGIEMTSSDVTLGTASNPSEYRGRVTSLNGANIAAHVARSDGGTVRLIVQLDIDPNTGQASGTVQASP